MRSRRASAASERRHLFLQDEGVRLNERLALALRHRLRLRSGVNGGEIEGGDSEALARDCPRRLRRGSRRPRALREESRLERAVAAAGVPRRAGAAVTDWRGSRAKRARTSRRWLELMEERGLSLGRDPRRPLRARPARAAAQRLGRTPARPAPHRGHHRVAQPRAAATARRGARRRSVEAPLRRAGAQRRRAPEALRAARAGRRRRRRGRRALERIARRGSGAAREATAARCDSLSCERRRAGARAPDARRRPSPTRVSAQLLLFPQLLDDVVFAV